MDGNRVTTRVVLDTNVLVAAAYAPASASRAIVEACLHGELEAIMSEETVRAFHENRLLFCELSQFRSLSEDVVRILHADRDTVASSVKVDYIVVAQPSVAERGQIE